MIGRVRWIMRVPVVHLWQQTPQRIQKIKVGTGVQVCRSESTGGMGNEECTHAFLVFCVPQVLFHRLCYIYNVIFLLCCDGDRFHAITSSIFFRFSVPQGSAVGHIWGLSCFHFPTFPFFTQQATKKPWKNACYFRTNVL